MKEIPETTQSKGFFVITGSSLMSLATAGSEDSRTWQAAPARSKNEMLHFVQHDIFFFLSIIWKLSDEGIHSPSSKG